MSVELPYTLQTIQDRVHTLVENDPTTPSTTDDEWSIRYRLICQAINNWESEDIYWNELWKPYTHATPVTAGVTAYSLASGAPDFSAPGSFIKITDSQGNFQYLDVVHPEDLQKFRDNARVCYFTGNVGSGYTLNLGFTPATGDNVTGGTISFNYYKNAAIPASTTDTTFAPEMSNPDYIVYWVAAQKHLMDGNTNQYQVYSDMAQDNLDNMRIFNDLRPINADMRLDDVEVVRDNAYLGG